MRSFFLLFFLVCAPPVEITSESDIKDVAVEEAKFTREGLTMLIRNETDEHVTLLRGIVCAGKRPGTDLDNPGEGCRRSIWGTTSPPTRPHGRSRNA
jgi:hypothetical protein